MISVPFTALWPWRVGGLTKVAEGDGDGVFGGAASAEVPSPKTTATTLVRMAVLRRFMSVPLKMDDLIPR